MGYGKGNVGTGMHVIGPHAYRSRMTYTDEQLKSLRLQVLSEARTLNALGGVSENIDEVKCSQLPWGKHRWTSKEKSDLRLEERVYNINNSILRYLYDGANVRAIDQHCRTQRLDSFVSMSWCDDCSLMGYTNIKLYGVKKSQNHTCFLNVYARDLLEHGYESAVQIYMDGEPLLDYPRIDGFVYIRDRTSGFYWLTEASARMLCSLDGDEVIGTRIAILVEHLVKEFCTYVRSVGGKFLIRSVDTSAWQDNAAAEVVEGYRRFLPWAVTELEKTGKPSELIVRELDSKFWFYNYVEQLMRPAVIA
jgi:hypothetical protein